MPEMESLIPHHYNGRDLTKGEVFEADLKYVAVLIALGRARLVGETAVGEGAALQMHDLSLNTPAGHLRRNMSKKKRGDR